MTYIVKLNVFSWLFASPKIQLSKHLHSPIISDDLLYYVINGFSFRNKKYPLSFLIPCLYLSSRVVYSKMLNKSGVRTGSKSAKQARRMIVFRFLAGCQQEELLFYLRMAFRLYASTVQGNLSSSNTEYGKSDLINHGLRNYGLGQFSSFAFILKLFFL